MDIPKNSEFKHESYQDTKTIVKYLRSLTDGLEKGLITLGNEREIVELEPRGLVKTEIKAKRKSDYARLSLKISWKEEATTSKNRQDQLFISTSEEN